MIRRILISGALMALLGVALGAFGAHGLRSVLSEAMFAAFETGVRYHVMHALGMLIAGLSLAFVPSRYFHQAAWTFFLGILLFSGSLYGLSTTGIPALGVITPVGGLCLMVGWGLLAWGYWKACPLNDIPVSPPHD
jgi:uncharacterized membrane protein YgdD (TMEM256/DUF423 family)